MSRKAAPHLSEALRANLPSGKRRPKVRRIKAGKPEIPVDIDALARYLAAGGMARHYIDKLGVHRCVVYRRVDMMRRVVRRYLIGAGREARADEIAGGDMADVALLWLSIDPELRGILEDSRLRACQAYLETGEW